ncbi:MAG: alpha/beta fold hydrolase [bacterium]|nr:alpha/beta fold hydrolase [bacterium]
MFLKMSHCQAPSPKYNNSFGENKSYREFIGTIDEIIEKKESVERNNIFVKLISDKEEILYIDDFFIVFIIEQTHKILLSDYISKPLPKEIRLKLENITIENKWSKPFLKSVEKIFPNYSESENSFIYNEINPGTPKEDYYHRYIDVPVSYKDPGKGTFKLYYELCSDYDETKPTIMIPTDGQRSLSQVGWADKYKKMFSLEDFNTVTDEYRGMYASKIPIVENKNADWGILYEILNSDNVIEDIELIRKDLLGDKPIYILGGSGTAMIGLKYISKYYEKVEKAFLMSFVKDAKGCSEAGVFFFNNFLNKNNLSDQFESLYHKDRIDMKQTLFLIQRLFYYDQKIVKNMIIELSEDKFDLFEKYNKQLGSLDFFVRSAQKYRPWVVVFMYETNINTSSDSMPDINYPFYKIAEPIREYYISNEEETPSLFSIENLDEIDTEILLVAGRLDQVFPLFEMKRIHSGLKNSELAIFEAYHCLETPKESKLCRNNLANLFFKTGNKSPEIKRYLKIHGDKCNFIKFEE